MSRATDKLARADTKVRVENVVVTPEAALEILGRKDSNRTVHERRVNAYARDMAGGEWKLNGETIKLAPDGNLIDGEHRLWAVIRANELDPSFKGVPMAVAQNVDRETRRTIDTGKPRSYTDVLRIRGLGAEGRVLGSIMRNIVLYRHGKLAGRTSISSQGGATGSTLVTHSEIDAVYADKKTLQTLSYFVERWGQSGNSVRVAKPVPVGFVYWRAAQDDPAKAEEWAEGVATGVDMKADDPRYQLRERYLEPTTRRMAYAEALALAIKSWNLYSTGERVANLRWRTRGNAAEGFPEFLSDQRKSSRSGLTAEETKAKLRRQRADKRLKALDAEAKTVVTHVQRHPGISANKLRDMSALSPKRFESVVGALVTAGIVEDQGVGRMHSYIYANGNGEA